MSNTSNIPNDVRLVTTAYVSVSMSQLGQIKETFDLFWCNDLCESLILDTRPEGSEYTKEELVEILGEEIAEICINKLCVFHL